MDIKANDNRKDRIRTAAILAGILVLVTFPLLRGYIPDSGENAVWAGRIGTIFHGRGIVPIYSVCAFFLQVLTLCSAYRMFCTFFEEETERLTGTLFFMTCPYHLYLIYDKGDFAESAVWCLFALFLSESAKLVRMMKEDQRNVRKAAEGKSFLLALASLAGMVSAFMIGYIQPQGSFSEKGYVFGQFFTTFFYKEAHPGIGLGLFTGVGLWVFYMVDGKARRYRAIGNCFLLAAVLALMSLIKFPWDVAARVSGLAMKILWHLETPVFFFGFANIFLCFPAVKGVQLAGESSSEFVRVVLRAVAIALAVGVGLYLCDYYLYYQYPMDI